MPTNKNPVQIRVYPPESTELRRIARQENNHASEVGQRIIKEGIRARRHTVGVRAKS